MQVWNYSFTVPCALLMATLLAFYFSRPRLPINLNRTFLGLLALQLLVMVFDVGSSLADENYTRFSPEALYALNMAFFILFHLRILWFYRFTLDILHEQSRPFRVATALPCIIACLVTLSSPLTGAVFSIQGGAYQSGPLYRILYVCFFFYILLSIVMLGVRGRRLQKSELASAIAFNLVLAAGNVVRFLFPYLLAMNTFCMVAIVIIYLEFLNPDLYLTNRGPAFNMRGFRLVMANLPERRECQMLGFVLKNYNYERSILGAGQMDEVLGQVVQHITRTFPGTLLFYLRSGRFALVRTAPTDWENVRDQIHERFGQSWQTEHIDLSLNIGFAFSTVEAGAKDSESAVTNLLIALDEARDASDRETSLSTTIPRSNQVVSQHVSVLHSLELALDQDGVEVFLQPLVDSASREIVAAEALARIRDTSGEIIPPSAFIPLAEKSGYINLLGDQVLEKTCRFIGSHNMDALGLRWINVNLSPIQCMQHDIAERIIPVLQRFQVPARLVHLELTEQSMIDYSLLESQLLALRQSGFELSLDDFGTGYSNLARVKHYPFTNIKIDMGVVWDYTRHRDDLLPAIIQGFHQMGFSITAEGIEDQATAEALTSIGVDYLQGFFFCEPLPAEEFVKRYR